MGNTLTRGFLEPIEEGTAGFIFQLSEKVRFSLLLIIIN
jgi:hypothetical protein